jgi:hypothetical protein
MVASIPHIPSVQSTELENPPPLFLNSARNLVWILIRFMFYTVRSLDEETAF